MRYIKEFNDFINEEVGVKFSMDLCDKIQKYVISDIEYIENKKRNSDEEYSSLLFNNRRIAITYNISEILYDKPVIKLGAWLLYHLLDRDYDEVLQNSLNKILEYGDFDKLEIGDIIIDIKYIPYYETNGTKLGALIYPLSYTNMYDNLTFVIEINISNLIHNPEHINTTVKHELTHLTQIINGFCLSIGEKLLKCDNINKDTIKDILETSWKNEKLVGGPKTKTYSKENILKMDKIEKGVKDKDNLAYILNDHEYQTLINDKVIIYIDDFIKKLKEKNIDIINTLKKFDGKKQAGEIERFVIDISKTLLGGHIIYGDEDVYNEPDLLIKLIRLYRKEIDKDVVKLIRKKLNEMVK